MNFTPVGDLLGHLREQNDALLSALRSLYDRMLTHHDGSEEAYAALMAARLAILRAEGGK